MQRNVLEATFLGLEGPQAMYTASIPRSAVGNEQSAEAEASSETVSVPAERLAVWGIAHEGSGDGAADSGTAWAEDLLD